MKVKDLIELLKQYDPELTVYDIYDGEWIEKEEDKIHVSGNNLILFES